MPLFLVTGRANAGKSGTLYRRIEEACDAGAQPTLLLPVAQDVRRAATEFAGKGVFGVNFLTLDGWIDQLWRLHGDGRRLVGQTARAALIGLAVEGCRLSLLSESASRPGFLSVIADTARRMVDPPGPADSGLDRELVAILDAYERLLRTCGLVEPARAAAALGRRPPIAGGPVAVNRFTDLSPAQETFLVGMADKNEVLIALPWESGFSATAALDPLVTRLKSVATRAEAIASPPADDELATIESELYRPRRVHEFRGAVAFGLAAGDEAECGLAARIASQAVGEGIAPGRIALVFRDAGKRASLLAAALSSVGLDADFDVGEAFGGTSFGRAFLALADCCGGAGATRARMLAWALSPYSGITSEAVAAADAVWRSRRLDGAALLQDAERTLGEAGRAISECRALLRLPVTTDSAPGWNKLAGRMLFAAARVRGSRTLEAALDAGAHQCVLNAVSELAGIEPGAKSDELIRSLRRAKVTTSAFERRDAVQVADAHRVRGRRFDAVILGGLTAEEFSAEKREPLAATLLDRLGVPAGAEEALGERLLFYTLVSRARTKLVLLRQATDERGEAVRPSVFFDDVVDLYREPTAAGDQELPAGATVYRLGLAELAAAAPAFSVGRLRARALAAEAPIGVQSAGRGLADPSVLKRLAEIDEFSVTELETYLACPFKWFYERVIRPRQIDWEIDARELGSQAHAVLHEFYRAWGADYGRACVDTGTLPEAMTLLGEIDDRVRGMARVRPNGLAEELAQARSSDWARAIIEDDVTFLPGFEPVAHEFAFGRDAHITVSVGGVAVRGVVDRIERGEGGVVAVDYKSSKAVVGHGSFETYGLIQAPVYALAASQAFEAPVAGGLYRSLRSLAARGFYLSDEVCLGDRGSSRDGLSAAGVDEVLRQAEQRVVLAAEGIRLGQISPGPHKQQTCVSCAARSACQGAS